eukprot:Gb_09284 [translate_table: standard]
MEEKLTNPCKEEELNREKLRTMARSIRALHLLLSLQSLTSDSRIKPKQSLSSSADEVHKNSEKYERLLGAVRVLQEDLRAERYKVERLNTYNVYADVARLCLFIAGICALVALL